MSKTTMKTMSNTMFTTPISTSIAVTVLFLPSSRRNQNGIYSVCSTTLEVLKIKD
jgi:hypothetical protein